MLCKPKDIAQALFSGGLKMWIRCVKSDLEDVLKNVLKAVSTRTTLPVLTGINIKASGEKVVFRGTDLEVTIEATLSLVTVEEEGEVVVPGKIFTEIVRNMDDGQLEIRSEAGGTEVHIKSQRASYKVRTFAPEDFPQGRGIPEGKTIKLAGKELREALRKVVRSASRDETRHNLTGVYVEGGRKSITLAATDSYRLAVANLPCDGEAEGIIALVPSRPLDEVARMISDDEVEIVVSEGQIAVLQDNWVFSSRLIEGQFPSFKQLFPEESFVDCVVEREALHKALKAIGVILQNQPVKLTVTEKEITINAVTSDVAEGEEHVECEANGSIEVAFNFMYLFDGVTAISSPRLKIELQEGLKPAVIRPLQEEDFSYLLMPVRSPQV
jgi:DNA polymerase-3 subunit beta